MSILSGFKKYKDYILTSSGYQLSSRWTKSDAVVMGDGTDDTNTLEKNLGSIQGITDSLTATSSNVALSAAGGNNLQSQIDTLNSNLEELIQSYSVTISPNNPFILSGNGLYLINNNDFNTFTSYLAFIDKYNSGFILISNNVTAQISGSNDSSNKTITFNYIPNNGSTELHIIKLKWSFMHITHKF